jgi:hypothetical protein
VKPTRSVPITRRGKPIVGDALVGSAGSTVSNAPRTAARPDLAWVTRSRSHSWQRRVGAASLSQGLPTDPGWATMAGRPDLPL